MFDFLVRVMSFGRFRRLTSYTLLLTVTVTQLSQVCGLCDRYNCLPPDCHCAGVSGPPEIRVSETPQMILLSFDDAVLPEFDQLYRKLFQSGRWKNPNGCPILATFYVTHEGTDYGLVKRLYLDGHEMASHSVSHRLPQSNWTRASHQQWLDEIAGQRDNLVCIAGFLFYKFIVMYTWGDTVVIQSVDDCKRRHDVGMYHVASALRRTLQRTPC